MKKIYKNQNGFSLIEALLLIIAVALIAFVGYYVWHTQKQTDKTLNTAATTSTNASKTISQIAKPKHTAQEAVNAVQTTYNDYVKASTDPATGQPTGTTVALAAVKKDLTTSFYNQLQAKYAISSEVNGKLNPNAADYDLMTCAQNTLTHPVASLSSSSAPSATVEVSDGSLHFNVTVDLNSLLISNVSCPGA